MNHSEPAFKWKAGSRYHAKAEEAKQVFDSLEEKGELTAKKLVEVSKPEEAALHKDFEWDDEKAAGLWREQEGRVMIGSLVVCKKVESPAGEEPKELVVRAYHNIDDQGNGNYRSINAILANADWESVMYENAERELKSFVMKYRNLKKYAGLIEEIVRILEKSDDIA